MCIRDSTNTGTAGWSARSSENIGITPAYPRLASFGLQSGCMLLNFERTLTHSPPILFQLLPTNKLYAAQIREDIDTPPSPFFPALWLSQGLAGRMSHTMINSTIPPHFCRFAEQTRVHTAECFQKLWPFVIGQSNRCFPCMILLLTKQALCTSIFAKQVTIKVKTLLSTAHPSLW